MVKGRILNVGNRENEGEYFFSNAGAARRGTDLNGVTELGRIWVDWWHHGGSPCSAVAMVVQAGIVYIQSVKTELPPWLSLVALARPEEGKLQVTKAMQNQSAWTQKTDLVILSTLVSACCLLVDQSIIYVIAKSIFKVIKFLKFSVYAQESSKNELSENLCWMNTGHISIFFFSFGRWKQLRIEFSPSWEVSHCSPERWGKFGWTFTEEIES